MNKYQLFSEDDALILKLRKVFNQAQLEVNAPALFPKGSEGADLVVIDGDQLSPDETLSKLKQFKRDKIPVVYVFSSISGKEVMEVLKGGVISVLFKDYDADWIKSELRDILFNFNYLERVKNIAENDNRTRKFLGVVNHLTSDNDINKIMHDILEVMMDVFNLKSTIFCIAKKGKLTRKIMLGELRPKYQQEEWPLEDRSIRWLNRLQRRKEPIYITAGSPAHLLDAFPVNTVLLPLVIKEHFFGMITATLPSRSSKLTRSEQELLKAFSEQTSVALENAKLYWDVIKAREELIRQEKKALLNQTIISLNHEINNPLSIISMEAQMIQHRLEKNETKIEARIAKIEINIDRIKNILERISALQVENISTSEYLPGKRMLNLYEH